MMSTQMYKYAGSPTNVAPPCHASWAAVDEASDELRRTAASILPQMPPYHYVDKLLKDGVYRLYTYETPIGQAIAAQRFIGPVGSMGDPTGDGDDETGDAPPDPSASDSAWNDPTGVLNNGTTTAAGVDTNVPDSGDSSQDVGGGTNQIGGGGSSSGGQTTSEPVPQPNAQCTAWTASTSNSQVVGVAQSISYSNTPVAWSDQGHYQMTASDSTVWMLVMWWENGMKMVAAYKCTLAPGASPGTPTATTGMSTLEKVLIGAGVVLAVGGGTALAMSHHKKSRSHAHG